MGEQGFGICRGAKPFEEETEAHEDLLFSQEVEKAWQEYDNGEFQKKFKEDFLKELRAC